MASIDRYANVEHAREGRERRISLAWLASPITWFVIALAGVLLIFVGLWVDAYVHNNGGGEEKLFTFTNPGHPMAGFGIALAAAGALGGLTACLLANITTAEQAIRRFVPLTAAWVLAAGTGVFAITYIAATGTSVGANHGDDHGDHGATTSTGNAAAAADHHDASEAGIAQALIDDGIDPSGGSVTDPSTVPGALTQGASGHPDGRHDYGQHPTYTTFVSVDNPASLLDQFPEGTLTEADLPLLKDQLAQVRAVADRFPTTQAAEAAGYQNTTIDVPFMGHHYLNNAYVTDGVFDPSKPEGLLFSKIDDGPPRLVGVWFLIIPAVNPGVTMDVQPEGFAGDLDLWHAHIGLCLGGSTGASEGVTREECTSTGGNFMADLRWMMHVWVAPEATENPAGFFAYLNEDLYQKQVAAKGASASTGTTQ
jgi:hypothetical protein